MLTESFTKALDMVVVSGQATWAEVAVVSRPSGSPALLARENLVADVAPNTKINIGTASDRFDVLWLGNARLKVGFKVVNEYVLPLVQIGNEWLVYVDCREGGADGLGTLRQGLAEHAGGEVGLMIAADNPDTDLVVGLSSKKSEGFFNKVVETVRQKLEKPAVKGVVLYADTDRKKVEAAAGQGGKIVAFRPITLPADSGSKYVAVRQEDRQTVHEAKNWVIADDVDSTGASLTAIKLAIIMEKGIVVPQSILSALERGVIIPREIITALESGLEINKAILSSLDHGGNISSVYLGGLKKETVEKRRIDLLRNLYSSKIAVNTDELQLVTLTRENFMRLLVQIVEVLEIPQERWKSVIEQFRRIELGMSNVGFYCIVQEFKYVEGQVPPMPIDNRVLMRIPVWKEPPLN